MKKILFGIFSFISCCNCTQSQNKNLENFGDISSITSPDKLKWQQLKANYSFSPADINSRITYNQYPIINPSNIINLEGWAGEEVSAEVVVSAKVNVNPFNINFSNLNSANGSIR